MHACPTGQQAPNMGWELIWELMGHHLPRHFLAGVRVSPQGERDDKVIAVHADDPEFKGFSDIKQLPPHRLAEIKR